jgi:D-3-phosphoglycerate dehydrogenase
MSLCVAIGAPSFAGNDDAPKRLLLEAGVEIKTNPFQRRLTEAEISVLLEGTDGLVAGPEPLTAMVLEASAQRLKAIARVGHDISNIDLAAAAACGVRVSSTPGPPADAVAELVLGALLAIARKIITLNASMHAGRWEPADGWELRGKTVLVVGHGHVGSRVSHLLRAFGCEIVISDPNPQLPVPEGARLLPLDAALPLADIVTLHAPGPDTLLDDPQFAMMKRGVVLLNGASGDLIGRSAFIRALEGGVLAAAWFDAYWEQPYSRGVLAKYDNLLLTPHTGTRTIECRRAVELQAVRNLLRDLGLAVPEAA